MDLADDFIIELSNGRYPSATSVAVDPVAIVAMRKDTVVPAAFLAKKFEAYVCQDTLLMSPLSTQNGH